MINALSPTWVLRVLTIVIMAALALSMLAQQAVSPDPASQDAVSTLIDAGKPALFLLNLFLLLMTWWRFFWLVHWAARAKYWWFPWVGGEWRGELKSNWPRVQAMMEAARGNRPPFDTTNDEIDLLTVKVKARIKCELLAIRIHIEMVGTKRFSDTIFVRPQKKSGEQPALYYVYRQHDLGTPAVTDSREHLGAAILRVNEQGELHGTYWTARNEERGLTTAGVIVLRRVRKPRKRAQRTSPQETQH
jgi:hypothetical protein